MLGRERGALPGLGDRCRQHQRYGQSETDPDIVDELRQGQMPGESCDGNRGCADEPLAHQYCRFVRSGEEHREDARGKTDIAKLIDPGPKPVVLTP